MTNRTCQFLFAALLVLCAVFSDAQVAPFQGLGNAQFFDNNGNPLTSGVLYSYQAGTSTQQATYTDSTGTILNPNPIPFGSGARVSIWLTSAAVYKFVLCAQNDGPFCSPGDVLFSVDQVPGSPTSSGGGGGGSGAPFISNSANPATSGILRLASGDTVCYRNTANSANLCLRKDANDLLSWDGGSLKFPEVAAPTGVAGFDLLWADNSSHRWKVALNGGTTQQLVVAGGDITNSDLVNQVHFGATATPFSGTAPSTNQYLQWNGTNIVGGCPLPCVLYSTNTGSLNATYAAVTMTTAPASGAMYRLSVFVDQSAIGTGCSTATTVTPQVIYTDPASGAPTPSNVFTISIGNNGGLGPILSLANIQTFRSVGSQPIQFQVTYAVGTCTTGPKYTAYPVLEQLTAN